MFSTLSPVPRIENVNIVRGLVKRVQFELLNSQNLHKYVNIPEKFKFTKSVRPIRANRSKAILYFNLNRQHETPVPTFARVCDEYLPCSYLHKVFYISGLGHISWCALRLIRKKDKFNHNMYTFMAFLAVISFIFYDNKQAWQQLCLVLFLTFKSRGCKLNIDIQISTINNKVIKTPYCKNQITKFNKQ